MAKIPFDIKYRPQIESGEYKVETRDGRRARIICWDAIGPSPIIVLFLTDDGRETTTQNHPDGRWCDDLNYESDYDLFIVTPEEEMSEFEKAVGLALTDTQLIPRDKDGIANIHDINEFIKDKAAKLLTSAREQFIKDGYVVEKKAFHDAVEKVAPEVMKEVSDKVDMEEALRLGYEKGKADALKDLPRWKKHKEASDKLATVWNDFVTPWLDWRGYRIAVRDLEKLPGFKEDEK